MTGTRLRKARAIFERLGDMPPGRRGPILAEACADDEQLQAFVEELLVNHDGGMGEFLAKPTCLADADQVSAAAIRLPRRVGRYDIVRVIGEGGMGVVYEARQEHPQRTVALKVIRSGLPSEHMLRRFEHEAEVLGQLQHPGIAHIYEAAEAELVLETGVTARQPYFAMELIRGAPLTDHAENNNLTTPERLELVARVCDAVEHAHKKGVIHRDLKPGNILVDDSGQPKVLDFGVARVTGADVRSLTARTGAGQLLGTVPYMSPEQVAGDSSQLDTRSDVYALGVLLYELLSGSVPLDVRNLSIPEAARKIHDDQPPRLGSVNRTLRGEVETIVTRALEKDKTRRYQSAAELAADIRRYLRGEPIEAKRDSALYVLSKHLRRYRWAAGVALLVVLGLAAFAIYASAQAGRYSRLAEQERSARKSAETAQQHAGAAEQEAVGQREIAEQEALRAQSVTGFLVNMLGLADPDITQTPNMTRRTMLDRASAEVGPAFRGQPAAEATVRTVIGRAYATLGELELAEIHLRRALEIRTYETDADRREIYEVLWPYSHIMEELGDFRREGIWWNLWSTGRALLTDAHPELTSALRQFGDEANRQADFQAERVAASFAELTALAAKALPEDDRDWLLLADYLYLCGQRIAESGHPGAACEPLRHTIRIQRRFLAETNTRIVRSFGQLITYALRDGRHQQAEHDTREAIELLTRILTDDHWYVAVFRARLGACLAGQGRDAEAEALLTENYERVAEARGIHNELTWTLLDYLIELYESTGRPGEAAEYRNIMAEGVAGSEVVPPTLERARAAHGREYRELWNAWERFIHAVNEDVDGVPVAIAELLELRRRLLPDEHALAALQVPLLLRWCMIYKNKIGGFNEHTYRVFRETERICRANKYLRPIHRSDSAFWLAWYLDVRGEHAEAEQFAREYVKIQSAYERRLWHKGAVGYGMLGAILLHQQRFAEAEPWLVDAHAIYLDLLGPSGANTVLVRNDLIRLYETWEKPYEAAEYRVLHLRHLLDHDAGVRELNNRSWRLVALPGLPNEVYDVALEAAARVNSLRPDDADYLNTLGVAQYRSGIYDQALATLSRADELHSRDRRGGIPEDVAFIAMSLYQLGRVDEASAALDRMRALIHELPVDHSKELRGFRREAETLVARTP